MITREGLPFAAVLTLGALPLQMGILSGVGAAVLVFGFFAGAWADRVHRRPLLIAADAGRFVLLGSVPLAAALHRLTMVPLYVVEAAAAVLTVLFDAGYQAYLPALVGPESVVEANEKMALTQSIAEVSGPGITGLLVQLITASIAILVDAFSYLCSAISLVLIRRPEPLIPKHPDRRISDEIVEGIRFSWHTPALRSLLAFASTGAFCMGFYSSLYLVFATRELHLSPALLGAVISVGGAANLIGALSAERLVKRLGVRRALTASSVILGIGALLPPLAKGPVVTSAALLMLAQIFDVAWPILNVCETTLRQTIAPDRLRGRVNTAMHLMFRGVLPLGR